jgi:hypothetical protein
MSEPRKTVAVLTHESDNFWRQRYLLQLMIPRWEAMGVRVVVVAGVREFVPADAALMHVDLSVVPDEYLELASRYPRVVNGRVGDIRKRRVSDLVVDRKGPDPGPVIVKTDWNCGGLREFRAGLLESAFGKQLARIDHYAIAARVLSRVEARRSWRRRRVLPVGSYRVFSCRDEVPEEVWENPNLVVERFLVEREGSDYACRHWLFFGDREVSRRTVSPHAVVKANARLSPLDEGVPEELRVRRETLGFDYGKFDYGLVDGRVVLYDANRTPGSLADPTRHTATIEALSAGISAYL